MTFYVVTGVWRTTHESGERIDATGMYLLLYRVT